MTNPGIDNALVERLIRLRDYRRQLFDVDGQTTEGDDVDVALTEAAEHIETLASGYAEMKREVEAAGEILRDIIGNANEAPRFGPFDQIDNSGEAYQSAAFEKALDRGRQYLAQRSNHVRE